MRIRRWRAVGASCAIVLALSLAGCADAGPSTGQTSATTTVTVSPDPQASTTSPQTATPGSATPGGAMQACTAITGSIRLGDLAITAPTVLYGFSADYMLPDNLPTDKPLSVTIQNNSGYVLGSPIESRAVVGGAYLIDICNTSTTHTHSLTIFGVKLNSLTSYSGHLNAINACAFLYGRSGGWGGECDTGFEPNLTLSFQLPGSATPGSAQTQRPGSPVQLAPGQSEAISYAITPPSSATITTYLLGLGVDGAAVVYPSALLTQADVDAPIARHWSGSTCTTSQMQAQIPATSPANTYYACS